MNKLAALLVLFTCSCLAGDLTTLDGTTYRNVKVSRVEADGLVITHAAGGCKLDFLKLPEEVRKQYSYDAAKAEAAKKAAASAAKTGGWDEMDQRMIFLTVQLSSVEASLTALNRALVSLGIQQVTRQSAGTIAQQANEAMDRNAGGPVPWADFYGRTAEKFFYHPTDKRSSYHTLTILRQQSPAWDTAPSQGVPSRQGLPVHQRPPQFDYIYRANADAEKRAQAEVARLGNNAGAILERRRQLEAEQSALWSKIAFRAVAGRELLSKPLYYYDLKSAEPDSAEGRQRLEALRAVMDFLRNGNKLGAMVERGVDGDAARCYNQLQEGVITARGEMERRVMAQPAVAGDISDRRTMLGKFVAVAKRMGEVSANITDAHRLALDGDRAGDQGRKLTFRSQLQQSLMLCAESLLAGDECVNELARDWNVQPATQTAAPASATVQTSSVVPAASSVSVAGGGVSALPISSAWLPLDIAAACTADVISTESHLSKDQFDPNGTRLMSASFLSKKGYSETGVPDDGRVLIPDSTPPAIFQMRMPPAKNAILISGPEGTQPQPVTIELTAGDRRHYSELAILHCATWGSGTLRVLLRYETGADVSTIIPVVDWSLRGRTGPVPAELRPVVVSRCIAPKLGPNWVSWLVNLFTQSVSTDPARALRALTFSFEAATPPKGESEKNARRNFIAAIFAISAQPASAPAIVMRSAETPTPAATVPQPAGQPWTNSLGMKFVPVPGTSVQFSIWDTRVKDYRAFVTATGRSWKKPSFKQGPTHPAVNVSWDEAKAFCVWLTEKERRAGTLSSSQEYRLPTDLEWSAAVGLEKKTGSTKDVYPWGTEWPPPHGAGNYGSKWKVDEFENTSPVGSFAANRFGLYDMGGNVWQWCEDWFGTDQIYRIVRGGSWDSDQPRPLLSSRRAGQTPSHSRDTHGFRCVLAGGGMSTPQVQSGTASTATNPSVPTPAAVALPPGQQPGQPWTNSLGMKFVPVPGTSVQFSVWETRVRDFEAFVQATGYDATKNAFTLAADGFKRRGGSWKSPGFAQTAEHPVCCVSWDDAKAFCKWLTDKERGEGRLRADHEYRLPTDVEWSAAVGLTGETGGTPKEKGVKNKDVYPWGSQWPPPSGAGNYAGEEAKNADWSRLRVISGYNDGYLRTSPVGSFNTNQFGLYDMSGNVWEWCKDWYDTDQKNRVSRGGSWMSSDTPVFLPSSCRMSLSPDTRGVCYGFRCVLAGGGVSASR